MSENLRGGRIILYLIDFPPRYCPNCGYEACWTFDSQKDFRNGRSYSCVICQTRFCYVEREKLIETADAAGSDLPRFESVTHD